VRARTEIEWNIDWVGAPAVWNASERGRGTIYANADTGVFWKHEALVGNYLGSKSNGQIDHDYAWWDGVKKALTRGQGPCGINSQEPCDDNGHGTHTTRYIYFKDMLIAIVRRLEDWALALLQRPSGWRAVIWIAAWAAPSPISAACNSFWRQPT
jgi:subtilisin family serine protease